MVSINDSLINDRNLTVWRSEFVECRYERANNTILPQLCLEEDKMYCCYNNAFLDENDYCCPFDQLLLEHRALHYFIHLLVWVNLIVLVLIIMALICLVIHSNQIIDEDNADNEEMIKSIKSNKERKEELAQAFRQFY